MDKPKDSSKENTVILPAEGYPFSFGKIRGCFKILGTATDQRFVSAEIPEISPSTLAAPLHRHHNEDEYTYVLQGRVGIMVGDKVVTAGPGTWVVKPRGQWHTFWNAGDTPCQLIEIVSPAGFENYFREVADAGGDSAKLAQINQKYSIDMDLERTVALCERFGLTFPELRS